MESLARLNELYKDLVDFSQSRLVNIERLWLELEDSLQGFRSLLDKKSKSDESRRQLESGQFFSVLLALYCVADHFHRKVQRRRRSIRSQ